MSDPKRPIDEPGGCAKFLNELGTFVILLLALLGLITFIVGGGLAVIAPLPGA